MTEMVMINHPKLYVHLSTGTEGPRHDPYSFNEYCVTTPMGVTVLHEGLGTWIKYNGELLNTPHGEHYVRKHVFPRLTGFTIEQIERIVRKRSSRCHTCGGSNFRQEAGYPGEHFTVCCGCGDVMSTYFNKSEVE